MKKLSILAAILCLSFAGYAQDGEAFSNNKVTLEIASACRLVITIAIYATAVLFFVKLVLDYAIKSKIVNKDLPETTVARLLPERSTNKNVNLKWFMLLASAGLGFLLVYSLRPFGIHSLAILFLSVAAGFLGHHLVTRQNK